MMHNFEGGDLKKATIQVVVLLCLAITCSLIGFFIIPSIFGYGFVRSIGMFAGWGLTLLAIIPTIKIFRLLKIRTSMTGILAGLVLILLWYGQYALEFIDSYIIFYLSLFVYPVISAVVIILLLRNIQFEYLFAKFGLFLFSLVLSTEKWPTPPIEKWPTKS